MRDEYGALLCDESISDADKPTQWSDMEFHIKRKLTSNETRAKALRHMLNYGTALVVLKVQVYNISPPTNIVWRQDNVELNGTSSYSDKDALDPPITHTITGVLRYSTGQVTWTYSTNQAESAKRGAYTKMSTCTVKAREVGDVIEYVEQLCGSP